MVAGWVAGAKGPRRWGTAGVPGSAVAAVIGYYLAGGVRSQLIFGVINGA